MGGVGGSWWPFCIWCVSTLNGMKGGGGRDRKKREGRRGQGEKESEKEQEGKLNLKEKSELPATSWSLNKKQNLIKIGRLINL